MHDLTRSTLLAFFLTASISILAGEEKRPMEHLDTLTKMTSKELVAFANDALVDRLSLERKLLDIVDGQSSNEVRCAVVFLLGKFRMAGAVDTLKGHIAMKSESQELNDKRPLWAELPTVQALINIGNPAVPKMLDLIQNSPDAKVRELAASVILHIETESVGEFILEKAMNGQANAEQKERLRVAIQFLKDEDMRRHPKPPEKSEK